MQRSTVYSPARGGLESNIARGFPVALSGVGEELEDQPLSARTLLGTFSSTVHLGLLDIKILAFAIERWRYQGGQTASDAVSFTLYQLGTALYGREPDGEERRLMREAIDRLFKVELNAYGIDARRDDGRVRKIARDGRLFAEKETAWDELAEDADAAEAAREMGGRRAVSFSVWLGPWLAAQVAAGNITYLDFPTIRKLSGLAERLWIFLEAEPFVVVDDKEFLAADIPASDELFATLGMRFARPTDARKALRRASTRICAADPRYGAIDLTKTAGQWKLSAYRRHEAESDRIEQAA